MLDPDKREANNPPIIAVIIPEMGGKPDAVAMAKQSGKAIKETPNPANKSDFQTELKPTTFFDVLFVDIFYKEGSMCDIKS
jgi:hypothetical protein